jgi:hypothetical protein
MTEGYERGYAVAQEEAREQIERLEQEREALAKILAPDLANPSQEILLDRARDAKRSYLAVDHHINESNAALAQRNMALGKASHYKRAIRAAIAALTQVEGLYAAQIREALDTAYHGAADE